MRGAWVFGLVMMAGSAGAAAQDAAAMPVAVGGKPGVDACSVRGLAAGDVDVRVGPGEQYEIYDHLASGQSTFVCQSAGSWYGIVYGKADCGVSKPIAEQQIYIGGCRTGWVSARALTAAKD